MKQIATQGPNAIGASVKADQGLDLQFRLVVTLVRNNGFALGQAVDTVM